jgi:hypothetical protein
MRLRATAQHRVLLSAVPDAAKNPFENSKEPLQFVKAAGHPFGMTAFLPWFGDARNWLKAYRLRSATREFRVGHMANHHRV